jgi:hypothetical protein
MNANAFIRLRYGCTRHEEGVVVSNPVQVGKVKELMTSEARRTINKHFLSLARYFLMTWFDHGIFLVILTPMLYFNQE